MSRLFVIDRFIMKNVCCVWLLLLWKIIVVMIEKIVSLSVVSCVMKLVINVRLLVILMMIMSGSSVFDMFMCFMYCWVFV